MEQAQPKLLFPQLQSFYRCAEPLSWALIRITAGLMLIPHGWPKLMMGINATANMALVKRGIAPAEPLAVVLIIARDARRAVRRARPVHALLGRRHQHRDERDRLAPPAEVRLDRPGYEYPLFWGLVMLAIALRGGGPYSVDRVIGREL